MKINGIDPEVVEDVAGLLELLLNIIAGFKTHLDEQDALIEDIFEEFDLSEDLVKPEPVVNDIDRVLISGQAVVHQLRSRVGA